MKSILIQGAMESEISYLKDALTDLEEIEIDSFLFYQGQLESNTIVISKTGVGMVQAALATYIGIKHFQPEVVINQGLAGACSREIHRGDLVIGKTCIPMNSYCTSSKRQGEGSNPLEWTLLHFQEGEDKLEEWETKESLMNLVQQIPYANGKVQIGKIGSGDNWDKEEDRIDWFYQNYQILCEDMETVSCYQIATKLNCPVIGIRGISNNELLRETYEKSVAKECQQYVLEFCKKFIKEKENKRE